MKITSLTPPTPLTNRPETTTQLTRYRPSTKLPPGPVTSLAPKVPDRTELREAFDAFVGQTFYGQMLKSMRSTVGKPAYLHGGQAEETFRAQLDQKLVEQMSKANANSFTGAMFDQFEQQLGNLRQR